jgi:DNA-binding HxlR family transcriptional regulator
MTLRSDVQRHFPPCHITFAASLLSNKWKPVIIARLLKDPLRFSEIRRTIPQISSKVLSENLIELEAAGIVARQVISARPPRTLYSLTQKGKALKTVLEEMEKWGRTWVNESKATTSRY